MQSFPAILLIHTLRAILAHVEQTPDARLHPSELVEFTRTLHQQITTLERPWQPRIRGAA